MHAQPWNKRTVAEEEQNWDINSNPGTLCYTVGISQSRSADESCPAHQQISSQNSAIQKINLTTTFQIVKFWVEWAWLAGLCHCCPSFVALHIYCLYSHLAGSWNQGIIAHQTPHFRRPPKHVNNKGPSVFAQTSSICTFRTKSFKSIWKYISFGIYV